MIKGTYYWSLPSTLIRKWIKISIQKDDGHTLPKLTANHVKKKHFSSPSALHYTHYQKYSSCSDAPRRRACSFTTRRQTVLPTWSLPIKLLTRHLDHLNHWQLLKQNYWITAPNILSNQSLSSTLICFPQVRTVLFPLLQSQLSCCTREPSKHRKELLEDPTWVDSAANPFNKAAIPSLTILISQQLKPGAEKSVREPQGKEFLCIYPKSEHPSTKYLMKSSVPRALLTVKPKLVNRFVEFGAFFKLGRCLPTL